MDLEQEQSNTTPIHEGNPYFMGDHALVKFSGSEDGMGTSTYWLVDKNNHTIRPFESHMALDAVFGDELKTALEHAVTIVSPTTDQTGDITEGVLKDFSILGPEYSIREDGTSKQLHFSSHQLKRRYGKAINENGENLATEAVDGFLNLLKTHAARTGIPATFINKIREDHKLMAFYISAMAYGNYTLSHLYHDINNKYQEESK